MSEFSVLSIFSLSVEISTWLQANEQMCSPFQLATLKYEIINLLKHILVLYTGHFVFSMFLFSESWHDCRHEENHVLIRNLFTLKVCLPSRLLARDITMFGSFQVGE